jgi:hypothetical protein
LASIRPSSGINRIERCVTVKPVKERHRD